LLSWWSYYCCCVWTPSLFSNSICTDRSHNWLLPIIWIWILTYSILLEY
jgi:hypothetical protein